MVPDGADTFLMKSILHNWNDDRCEVILRNCQEALPSEGTLIVIERIMPEPATTEPADRSCVMSDLNMLRGPGGRKRTEAEYKRLAMLAGFAFVGATDIGSFSLVQFRKVGN
jgi:O-methyltransferase domain